MENVEGIFEGGRKKDDSTQVEVETLFAKIGKLEVALDFLKKSPSNSREHAAFMGGYGQRNDDGQRAVRVVGVAAFDVLSLS